MVAVNPIVEFIRQYDITSADNTKIYDEHAQDLRYNIETQTNTDIVSIFKHAPKSIIITGNAGDGKTRICRNVYNELTGKQLESWNKQGIEKITYNNYEVRIIKDLSELTDVVINEELNKLATCIEEKQPVYYLIAANEGKLTSSLQVDERLNNIRAKITSQLLTFENRAVEDELQVYNLLHLSTAENARKIMERWNQKEDWEVCESCDAKKNCIIYHNHQRLAKPSIQNRLYYVYRSLEVAQEHMTIRELLIHLAYTQLGGLTCEDVHKATHKALIQQSELAYYQNFFGETIEHEVYHDIIKQEKLRQFNPGRISHNDIDDFILNGDLSEKYSHIHHELFNQTIDTAYGYFKYELDEYRKMYNTSQDIGTELVIKWLPKLRKKYYFEVEDHDLRKNIPNLIDFPYRADFLKILTNPHSSTNQIRTRLIRGLNNHYAKQIVSDESRELYITTEKLYVTAIIPERDIKIEVPTSTNKDYQPTHLYFVVNNQRLIITITMFEYLMRLSCGGAYTVLEDEVDVRLNNFRNLIMNEQVPMESVNILTYMPDKNSYYLKQINYREEQKEESYDF